MRRNFWGLVGGLAMLALALNAQTALPTSALLRDYHFRSLGPAAAGGRIVDIAASERDPRLAVVAAASGGVWKTENMGTTWTPIFDHYGSSSIGAVAMFQADPKILWVGTGEANNRNSVAWGDGVYKSTDGGATFTNVGLRDSFQIARIVTDPADANTVYVAAVGDLWGSSGERGLFKTSDGGKTWTKLTDGLPRSANSGATDLVMDPQNPQVLYVAFYQRLRRPWRFDSGGPDGGIFKTSDGGAHWSKLGGGLPTGPTGRIGLAVYRKNPKIVMAIVEAPEKLTGTYRSEDGGATWAHVNDTNNRPFYYSQIRISPDDGNQVYLLTTSVQKSDDGGRTFRRLGAPFGPNYDYHAMWMDPNQPDVIYVGCDKGLWLTHDRGQSMQFFDNLPVEQFYKVATDLRTPYAVYGGLQDNGAYATMSFTRDVVGIRNDASWKMHWDDGQYVAVDPTNWRTVYSEGTQGTFRVVDPIGHTDTRRRATPETITNYAAATNGGKDAVRFNWTTPFILSPHDPERLYYGSNYLMTSTDAGQHWTIISGDLSKHDPAKNQIGTGGITPDNTGAEGYGTIYTIAESPLQKGLIWIGTDDGNVWLTRDGGAKWTELDANIPDVPKDMWVSRIAVSAADASTAYLSYDGHRSDNYASWLFKTSDFGKHWTNLSAALAPNDPVYCVTVDDKNPKLIFVGSERGLEVSFDAGQTFQMMESLPGSGLPTTAVYDVIVQPQTRDLILATHGHGLYVLDDISALEQWKAGDAAEAVGVFAQRPATLWVDMSRDGQTASNVWAGGNPPDVRPPNPQNRDRSHIQNTPVITLAFGAQAAGEATLAITDAAGETRTIAMAAQPGITRYAWDGRMTPPPARGAGRGRGDFTPPKPLEPGLYRLKVTLGGASASGTLTIKADPLSATDGKG